ncbi:AAA family ATPase [Tenacibaculum xiamenense]|uniref:AAA family ATPase n=1 Tax=Tenacibaculum xiamenense TaxID=1261553 RepID=UPI00389317F4
MKILKLWISKYNNLEDVEFDFKDSPLITLLVGRNGLGKSNFLEAITAIFTKLHLVKTEEELTTEVSSDFFSYIIEYRCRDNHIRIEAKDSKLLIFVKNDEQDKFSVISFSKFKKERNSKYLPDYVIAYYSGENKRIESLFSTHKKKRIDILKKDGIGDILGRFFFTDENFGELIFLMLWIFKDSKEYSELVGRIFKEFLHVEYTSEISVTLKSPDFYKEKQHDGVLEIQSNSDYSKDIWNLNGKVQKFIKVLLYNHSEHSEHSEPIMYQEDKREYIKLIHLDFEKLVDQIIEEYKNPVQFFDVLEAAYNIGIFHEIKSTINKQGARIQHNYAQLSEGEQQLLTVLGLILFTGEYDTLFLFDEPDTHLNPQWQRNFPELLDNFNINNENSQILVATHSPLIVQSSEKADTFLFRKEGDKVVIDQNMHHLRNWRIDQVLTSSYFNLNSARPVHMDDYMVLREKLMKSNKLTERDAEDLKKFENDFGVLPTGETSYEIRTFQLMNSVIEANKNDKD